MTHKMKLMSEPFEAVKSGSKTVELRLYDEKRQKILVGDILEFTNIDTDEQISVLVEELIRYPDFEKLYENYDKISMGYGKDETADPADMLDYYSVADIKKYGALAIVISLV